jgi:hypothetical protein
VTAAGAERAAPVGAGTAEEPVGPAQEEVPAAVDGADGLPRAGSGGPGERRRPAAGARERRAGRLLRRLRAAALLAEPSADRIALQADVRRRPPFRAPLGGCACVIPDSPPTG